MRSHFVYLEMFAVFLIQNTEILRNDVSEFYFLHVQTQNEGPDLSKCNFESIYNLPEIFHILLVHRNVTITKSGETETHT